MLGQNMFFFSGLTTSIQPNHLRFARFPALPFFGRRHRRWYGYTVDFQGARGVSWSIAAMWLTNNIVTFWFWKGVRIDQGNPNNPGQSEKGKIYVITPNPSQGFFFFGCCHASSACLGGTHVAHQPRIVSWKRSQSFHRPRCQTLWWNRIIGGDWSVGLDFHKSRVAFLLHPRGNVFIKTSTTISMMLCSSIVGCALDSENVWERRQQCFTTVAQGIDIWEVQPDLFQLLRSTRSCQVQCCLEFPSIGRKFRWVIPAG